MTPQFAAIPQKIVGPIHLNTPQWQDQVMVPMATFESPLWATVNRGARVTAKSGGIHANILSDCMTRSILLEAQSLAQAIFVRKYIDDNIDQCHQAIQQTTRHGKYQNHVTEIVGKLIYLRIAMNTDLASGHNMLTKAADAVGHWLIAQHPGLQFISVSANVCTDKKVSAVNALYGRGKHVAAETVITEKDCLKFLRSAPQQIVALHNKKNLIGSILAGSIRSANAHYANMLLAIYLATGQDGANIVEGSQGLTHVDITDKGDLYFSVNLPNIIVGTIGNGKHHDFVLENLKTLKCLDQNGKNEANSSQRLALITAATVLCGELSLLAAQTNTGELTRSHMILERKEKND